MTRSSRRIWSTNKSTPLTRSLLASSVACARCHHHKFDPFTMEDYYGMAGIFASTKTFFGTFTSPANNRGGHPLPIPHVAGETIFHQSLSAEKFAELKQTAAQLHAEHLEIEAATRAVFAGKKPQSNLRSLRCFPTFGVAAPSKASWKRSMIKDKLYP